MNEDNKSGNCCLGCIGFFLVVLFIGCLVGGLFSPVIAWCAAILMASLLCFVRAWCCDKSKEKLRLALTIFIAAVMIFYALMGLYKCDSSSSPSEPFDPDKCYWCEGMGYYMTEKGGKLYKCSHCNGTGRS